MEVIIRPQVFNVKPVDSLQDNSKEGRAVQMGMKSETEQGNHSSPQDKEGSDDPDKHLTSVMLGLKRMSAVLGLLPWDATEPEVSCKDKMRFFLIVLLVLMVGTTFVVIESK